MARITQNVPGLSCTMLDLAISRQNQKPEAFLDFFGAGEGIRTLDPDLGKVVLYP
jgi:hypothetical protein